MNFQNRIHTTEQLDDLSLSGKVLFNALSSLKFINRVFGNHRQLSNSVLKYCKTHPSKKNFRIVDLGCGGGDSISRIANKLEQKGIRASFIGIDGNAQSTAYANTKYAAAKNIQFITKNILEDSFSMPDCDLIISSHFMYHFKDDKLVKFLKNAKEKKIDYFIFSELNRNKVAYRLFKLSGFMLPISKVAKKDGLLAIRRAFTTKEIENILRKSDVKAYTITKKIWFRSLTKIEL